MPAGPLSRLLRAVGFATACVALSAAGHAWMSGRSIPVWALALGAGALLPPVHALAARRRGFPSIAAAMLAGELGLHELFGAAQRGTGVPGGATQAARHGTGWLSVAMCGGGHMLVPVRGTGGAAGAGTLPGSGAGAMAGMPGMAMATTSRSGALAGLPTGHAAMATGHGMTAMIAAHVIAGLLCAWWLRHGEAAAFGLLWTIAMGLLAPLRLVGARLPAVPARRAARPAAAAAPPWRRVLLAHAVVRRGPPAAIAWN